MRLVFLGTPDFAVPSLNALIDSGHDVILVITQPDRPRGRGKKRLGPPVKQEALKKAIPVVQPERIREMEIYDRLTGIKPDAVVVVAYGQIIPEDMLLIPRYGFINVHASLLPLYRGAAPINRAIMDGIDVTGVSIMKLDAGLDTGPVYMQAKERILSTDDAISLGKRLAVLGAEKLVEIIDLIERGKIRAVPQDHERATYAPMLKKEEGLIDWSMDVVTIFNRIRGLVPWPCAYTYMDSRLLKIWKATFVKEDHLQEHGMLIKDGKGIKVACKGGFIIPQKVQLEGKKIMDSQAFACGLKRSNVLLGGR